MHTSSDNSMLETQGDQHDSLNRLYTSNSAEDILRFYEHFEGPTQLVEWMKTRRRGRAAISEREGDSEVVVVIPTANVGGEYARKCTQIYRGLQIVFVESGRGDPYFNYARNSNAGVEYAIRRHSPKWIIISNDDMSKVDEPSVLLQGLSTLDHRKTRLVYPLPPTSYHSYTVCIAKPNRIRNALYRPLVEPFSERLRLYRKFQVEYDVGPLSGPFAKLYTRIHTFRLTGSITILSAAYTSSVGGKVFDETYINSVEDVDLSLTLSLEPQTIAEVNYRIADMVGGTIGGFSRTRTLREIANWVYFNHKARNQGFTHQGITNPPPHE